VTTIWKLDACDQSSLVRSGEVHPRELVDIALQRADTLNPLLNCVTSSFDQRFVSPTPPTPSSPLFGVPFLLKDAGQELAGTPHWVGCIALAEADHRSRLSTPLVRRLRQAGLIPVGKSSVPELSSGVTTEPAGFDPTRNPWDLERSPGGSSGGAAAAVAAGIVPIAHGADATGSIRFPAASCGVLGLKPSRGRIESTPPAGMTDHLAAWTDFVIARSVRDLVAALRLLSPTPTVPYDERPLRGQLRIGIMTDDPIIGYPVHRDCEAAVRLVARTLEDIGHEVSLAHPSGLEQFVDLIREPTSMISARGRSEQVEWVRSRLGPGHSGKVVSAALQAEAETGAEVTARDLAAAVHAMREAVACLPAWWREFDLLVTPTTRRPAWRLGARPGAAESGLFAAPWSFTGQPALTLPVFEEDARLPVGVQLVGRLGADEEILAVAQQLEQRLPWASKWPTIAES
jgi:amidase